MSVSLENQLETAYAKLAQANEPGLAAVTPRLSTLLLAQAPAPDAQEDDPEAAETNEQVPVPYLLLTAKKGKNAIPNTRIFEVDLTIEAGDNSRYASDTFALDALFRAATNPLLYKLLPGGTPQSPVAQTLFQALSASTDNLLVCGMPDRGEASDLEFSGSVTIRRQTAKFFCGCPNP